MLSPQLLSVMTACRRNLNPMSFELRLKRLMAVATVPTRQEDLSEYWDNTHSLTLFHSHTYMALGEILRTTLTSLGSPDHLHPEDCGKLMCNVVNHKSNVSLIFKGLVQSRAVCGLLRTIPRPPAGSIHRSQTPLSGTSLWLWKKQKKTRDGG